jgi:hypothetical protein
MMSSMVMVSGVVAARVRPIAPSYPYIRASGTPANAAIGQGPKGAAFKGARGRAGAA